MSYVYASRKLPFKNAVTTHGLQVVHTLTKSNGDFELVIEVLSSHFVVHHNVVFLTYDILADIIDAVPEPFDLEV